MHLCSGHTLKISTYQIQTQLPGKRKPNHDQVVETSNASDNDYQVFKSIFIQSPNRNLAWAVNIISEHKKNIQTWKRITKRRGVDHQLLPFATHFFLPIFICMLTLYASMTKYVCVAYHQNCHRDFAHLHSYSLPKTHTVCVCVSLSF